MTTDHQLLADYATKGSEQAFQELVSRYINLVYSTAARLVDGDTHMAEDVAQTVFTDLARLAGSLSKEVTLGGWLHRRVCHVAATTMRGIRRRQNRERQAMEIQAQEEVPEPEFEKITPVLDEAINLLKAEDRAAIMLRFFENRDLRFIGAALGSNEDAAQKRLARALEKLRVILARRGVAASTSVLIAVLSSQAVTAAPAGLASVIGGAALASAASKGGMTLALVKVMAITKAKLALGIIVAAGLGTTLVLEHRALVHLRSENESLQQQIAGMKAVRSAPAQLDNNAGNAEITDSSEEAKLRARINEMRQKTNDLAKLRETNQKLRTVVGQEDQADSVEEAEFKEQTQMRVQHLKQWGLSFRMYAMDHNNQLPGGFEQAAKVQNLESLLEFDTNHFAFVYQGSIDKLTNGSAILFKEKRARQSPKGEWIKVYGIADGSVQTIGKPNESDFEAYEKENSIQSN